MANFIIIVDPDPERRTSYCAAIKPRIAPVEGLTIAACSSGNFHAVWACNPAAPVSHHSDQEGAAVIWGVAMDEDGQRMDAAGLRVAWRDLSEPMPTAYDGYHAALRYSPVTGLVVGADLIGMFPIYWWASGNVLLVGSSPELFKYHPNFKTALDPLGLVGILLTMHLVDGNTLLQGVRRLAAGHLLIKTSQDAVSEIKQYQVPTSTRYLDFTYSAQLGIYDKVIDEAVKRHTEGYAQHGLLLSGGLDSRTLGGYLKRHGTATTALTFGLPGEIEVKCAARVARTLGFRHQIVEETSDKYVGYAESQTRWEHGAAGFNTLMTWGYYPHLRELAPAIISGYSMDCVLGGPLIQHYFTEPGPFKKVFPYYNRHAIAPILLERLLRPNLFDGLIQSCINRLQTIYESYSELESQREWCFELYHRQRFHVGAIPWRLTFGAWPVLPTLDRRTFEMAGGMPAAAVSERRAQKDLLCKHFPELAELPLDRNSYDTTPLQPRLRWLLAQTARIQLKRLKRFSPVKQMGRVERRTNYRTFDINGPGWKAVRRLAEPYRTKVYDLFNNDVLDELLPPPDVNIQVKDPIIDVSGIKSLLGFMLWSRDHL